MLIYSQTLPAYVSHALDIDTIQNLVHPKDDDLRRAVEGIKSNPSAYYPHSIQTIGLSDLINSNDLSKAREVGWRFLVTTTDGRKISAEVCTTSDDSGQNLLNQGPFTESTEQVLKYLQNHPLAQQRNYTFSNLKIPALYVMAVWLHAQVSSEDRVIPIPPSPDTLTSNRLYTISDFLDALRPSAKQELSEDL